MINPCGDDNEIHINGKCFRVDTTPRNRADAETNCQTLEMTLATHLMPTEVSYFFGSLSGQGRHWIGLDNPSGAIANWIDGK